HLWPGLARADQDPGGHDRARVHRGCRAHPRAGHQRRSVDNPCIRLRHRSGRARGRHGCAVSRSHRRHGQQLRHHPLRGGRHRWPRLDPRRGRRRLPGGPRRGLRPGLRADLRAGCHLPVDGGGRPLPARWTLRKGRDRMTQPLKTSDTSDTPETSGGPKDPAVPGTSGGPAGPGSRAALFAGRRRSSMRWIMLAVGLVTALALPWFVYPPVAMDIAAWALFAISVDLLLGYTGLLSFGHAAFWGSSAYATGLIATHWGLPFPVAILGGMLFAMAIAVPIGYLSVRRTGIYFAMVTLAFAQMIYFIANQLSDLTGGENGLQGIPKSFFGIESVETDSFYFYYAAIGLILLGIWAAWRVVHSPFGRVLVAIRDNPARARALGYDVDRYKVIVFVLSAGLAGLAGGVFAISHGFASLQELDWTTSGKVVLITVLGGIGTLWGPVLGAAVVTMLEDWLASSGFEGTGIILGSIFVVIVLLFRHGIWGTARDLLQRLPNRRRDRMH